MVSGLVKKAFSSVASLLFASVDDEPKQGVEALPDKLWPFIWFFVGQHKTPVFLVLFFLGLAAVCQALVPLFLGEIVDIFSTAEARQKLAGIAWLMVLLVVVGHGGYHLFWSIANFFTASAFYSYFREMIRCQLFEYLLRRDIGFFQNDYAGRLSTKVNNAGYDITEILDTTLFLVWTSLIGTITVVFMLFQLNVLFFLAFAGWITAYTFFCIYFVPKVAPKAANMAEAHSQLLGDLVDVISNIQLVKLFARGRHERKTVAKSAHMAAETARGFSIFWLLFRMGLGGFSVLLAGMVTMLAFYGYRQEWLSTGDVVLALTALPLVLTNTWIIATNAAAITESLGRIQDAMSAIVKPLGTTERSRRNKLKVTAKTSTIAFEAMSFHYGQGNGVIEGLNLEIPAGQKVGIIGPSGAGKSTLVNLLLGLFTAERGVIRINENDISKVTQESLAQNISIVSQDPSLFHRSIMENIRYGQPNATDEAVIKAAKKAQAHEFITGLKDHQGRTGYAAYVGERGVKLSGGQRQRIAIARVILADTPILILDEATSALDSEVETAIQEEMKTLMEGKTVIAIAHRLSTIRQMDRLIVLQAGKIIEDGTHTQLLRQRGLYGKLWRMQAGGFIGGNSTEQQLFTRNNLS